MLCFSGAFGDDRLDRRAARLFADLRDQRCVSIRRIANTRADQIAYYRLLGNDALTDDALEAVLTDHTAKLARDADHVLCIQDTTQFNFEAHAGRLGDDSGLGVIGDNASLGFFLHPTLVVDADAEHALGLSHVKLWTRSPDQPGKHTRKRLPIEAKESFRWIESVVRSRETLPDDVTLTTVADREGDLYDLFYRLPAATHALVRSRSDRQTRDGMLFDVLAAAPVSGEAVVRLRGDLRRDEPPREARLRYRHRPVNVLRPQTCRDPDAPVEVALWAVEVEESPETTPEGGEPVHWRLLTTHPVESVAEAERIVAWYRQRWHVEQLFRLMKTDGFALETSELEQGASLLRLTYLVLGAALDVFRLMLAERGEGSQPLWHVFDETERACLEALGGSLDGRTAKQQNPHPPGTLEWAAWIIARLGGWKGYRSQRRAGPIVYHRGLTRFRSLFEGWSLARGDVYTP